MLFPTLVTPTIMKRKKGKFCQSAIATIITRTFPKAKYDTRHRPRKITINDGLMVISSNDYT